MFCGATGSYTFVDLVLPEPPQAAHAMRGYFMFINPLVYGVVTAPQVLADLTYR